MIDAGTASISSRNATRRRDELRGEPGELGEFGVFHSQGANGTEPTESPSGRGSVGCFAHQGEENGSKPDGFTAIDYGFVPVSTHLGIQI